MHESFNSKNNEVVQLKNTFLTKKIAAIFAICKQVRLDTTELIIYTRDEQTLSAKRLDGETTIWETIKPGFFVTCL